MRLTPALAVALAVLPLLASAVRADPPEPDFVKRARKKVGAPPQQSGDDAPPVRGKPVAAERTEPLKQSKASGASADACLRRATQSDYGSFCHGFGDCVDYCRCACDFDITKWDPDKEDDEVAKCRLLPATARRIIPADDPSLLPVPTTYRYIDVDAQDGERATQEVLDALGRLDAQLASSESRRTRDYRIRVGSCYRPAIPESQIECGYVLKARYMVDKSTYDAAVQHWTWLGNPNNRGLAWPGATPHGAGFACDLILTDSRGHDCYDWRAGVTAGPKERRVPTCSIPARDAVRYAVEELTSASVGARRLNYEAWHFEWDPGNPSARCGSLRECDAHWPLTGHP